MKSKMFLAGLMILALSFSAFAQTQKANNSSENTEAVKQSKFTEIVYKSNLHCQNCVNKVQKELPYTVKGLKEVACDLESNTIKVVYNNQKVSPEEIKKSIKDLGYEANDIANNKAQGCSKTCSKKCGSTHQQSCSGNHKH